MSKEILQEFAEERSSIGKKMQDGFINSLQTNTFLLNLKRLTKHLPP